MEFGEIRARIHNNEPITYLEIRNDLMRRDDYYDVVEPYLKAFPDYWKRHPFKGRHTCYELGNHMEEIPFGYFEVALNPEGLQIFLDSPLSARIGGLYFRKSKDKALDLTPIAGATHFTNLRSLIIGQQEVEPIGFDSLFNSPNIQNLKWMNFPGACISVSTLSALANSPYLGKLEHLGMRGNSINTTGVVELANALLHNLRFLDLSYNKIGPLGVKALANAYHFKKLKTLDLSHCTRFGSVGAIALAKNLDLPKLRELFLWNSGVGSMGAWALAKSSRVQNLTLLDIRGASLGKITCNALLSSPYLKDCEFISDEEALFRFRHF